MTRWLPLAALLLAGCGLLHSPVVEGVCDALAAGDESVLESLAASQGVPVEVVRAVYLAACGPLAANRTQARAAGLHAAQNTKALMRGDAGQ